MNKKINMDVLSYNFNPDGTTQSIDVSFQLYEGGDNFNAKVNIKPETVGEDLDRLNRGQLEKRARALLRDWIMLDNDVEPKVPEEDVEPTKTN